MQTVTASYTEGAVHLAMVVVNARMNQIGRVLHPYETRWLVRHTFRIQYPLNPRDLIDRFADLVIAEVAKRCREESNK